MTVVRGADETPLQTEHRQLGRTFAMTVVSAGYGVMTAGLAYLVFLFMRAGDNFRTALWSRPSSPSLPSSPASGSSPWSGRGHGGVPGSGS